MTEKMFNISWVYLSPFIIVLYQDFVGFSESAKDPYVNNLTYNLYLTYFSNFSPVFWPLSSVDRLKLGLLFVWSYMVWPVLILTTLSIRVTLLYPLTTIVVSKLLLWLKAVLLEDSGPGVTLLLSLPFLVFEGALLINTFRSSRDLRVSLSPE